MKRFLGISLAAVAALGSLVGGGSSNGGGSTSAGSSTYAIWDPYPQFDNGSDWVSLLNKCGTSAGVTIKRTGYDTTDLTSKTLLAAQQGNSPDLLIVDNPVVSTLADAGVLTSTDQNHVDTSAI